MKTILFLLVAFATCLGAAKLKRSDITAIPVGAVNYQEATLKEILLDARRIAAEQNILLTADEAAIRDAAGKMITLEAGGLSLDGLLEFVTRSTGTEWKLEEDRITVFSSPKAQAAYARRSKSAIRRNLGTILVPEIVFENTDVVAALGKVREEAMAIAGIGSVPKIDTSEIPKAGIPVDNLRVKNASVPTLFDLLVCVSVSTIELGVDDFSIVVRDEAQRRESARAEREMAIRRRLGGNSGDDLFGGDPFVDAFAAPSSLRASPPAPRTPPRDPTTRHNTESYDHFGDNPFRSPVREQLSTFSVDVDTASYSNVRRMITDGERVPVDATRIEEFVNYFSYGYSPPAVGDGGEPIEGPPFAAHLESASAPWAPEHRLVRIALKGYEIDWKNRPPSNLVFLLDVSGSMDSENKLGLVKEAMRLLIKRLGERDRISIVVYAGSSGLVLPPTPANKRNKILKALDELEAGGSTNGGEGIALAYKTAREQFNQLGNNRVILCTDGDFNVGTTDEGSLVKLVEKQAKSGVFLTALGFGMGNYKDGMLETLSNKGNGNYAFIDSSKEARKVFVSDIAGTLVTIAKDVKLQVEFNPAKVGAYRLLGYENRLLEAQDFDDDTKDAGEIGAGHSVTAFYEIIPPGMEGEMLKAVSPLKYQKVEPVEADPENAGEMLTLKLRYKEPDGNESKLITIPFTDGGLAFEKASGDFRFAAAVAGFGMILRDSDYKGASGIGMVLEAAGAAIGEDTEGYRKEFLELVRKYGEAGD